MTRRGMLGPRRPKAELDAWCAQWKHRLTKLFDEKKCPTHNTPMIATSVHEVGTPREHTLHRCSVRGCAQTVRMFAAVQRKKAR
jgi:hypothetical protein